MSCEGTTSPNLIILKPVLYEKRKKHKFTVQNIKSQKTSEKRKYERIKGL